MAIELKIKAATLAEEARIIRRHERACRRKAANARASNFLTDAHVSNLTKLNLHRLRVVRPEARRTHLARAFGSGLSYKDVEQSTRPDKVLKKADIESIATMLRKYVSRDVSPEAVEAWIAAE